MTSDLPTEIKYLYIAAAGNILIGFIGVWVFMASGSEAILLDGLFNLTYAVSGLFAIRIARLLSRGDNEDFPFGYGFFEPLINGIKGMLVLGVSVFALVGSVDALLSGGRAIDAGMAVGYGIFASVVCWLMTWLVHKGAVQTQSPMLQADAENWRVNAWVSSCVLIAFAGIFLLRLIGFEQWIPYIDPLVVLTVVLLSISVPVRIAWNAIQSLLNRAPDRETVKQVTAIVDQQIAAIDIDRRYIRMIQPGRQRLVQVHVVLQPNESDLTVSRQDELRGCVERALQKVHASTTVDVLFTLDRHWAAPQSEIK